MFYLPTICQNKTLKTFSQLLYFNSYILCCKQALFKVRYHYCTVYAYLRIRYILSSFSRSKEKYKNVTTIFIIHVTGDQSSIRAASSDHTHRIIYGYTCNSFGQICAQSHTDSKALNVKMLSLQTLYTLQCHLHA